MSNKQAFKIWRKKRSNFFDHSTTLRIWRIWKVGGFVSLQSQLLPCCCQGACNHKHGSLKYSHKKFNINYFHSRYCFSFQDLVAKKRYYFKTYYYIKCAKYKLKFPVCCINLLILLSVDCNVPENITLDMFKFVQCKHCCCITQVFIRVEWLCTVISPLQSDCSSLIVLTNLQVSYCLPKLCC